MPRLKFLSAVVATAASVIVLSSSPASAQSSSSSGYRDAHRLGGSTSFYTPPLTTVDSVKRMAGAAGMAADVRKVLADSGIPQTADGVVSLLSGATSSVRGGLCTDAKPEDGVLVECDFQPGATLEWMAYRPRINDGDRTPGYLERVRWAGTSSFKAFLFRVTNNRRIYTFVLPQVCGNLSLMSVSEMRVTVTAPPAPTPEPLPPPPSPTSSFLRAGPPMPLVAIAPIPRPVVRYAIVWQPGYYAWGGVRYLWVPGVWARPPYPGAPWAPARWMHEPRGWYFARGYWRR
jgi:hypothetical protein